MRKCRLVLLGIYFLCIFNLTGEERREPLSKRVFRGGLACIIEEKTPYTGVLEDHYKSDTTLKATMRYKDGLLEGERILYYKTGLIKSRENYVGGKKNGITYSYYNNGQIMLKSDYLDGKKNGELLFYDKSGKVKNRVTYKNGKKENSKEL